MFAELKRLSKHISIYGLSNILSRSLSFLLLPIHTNLLDSTFHYGEAVILFAYLGIVNVIILHGMDTAFIRFYLLKETGFTKKNVFTTSFLSITAVSFTLSIVVLVNAGSISTMLFGSSANAQIIKWTAGILLLDALARLPMLVLRAEERSFSFLLFSAFNVVISVLMNIVLVKSRGVEGIFIANFIASGAMFILLIPISVNRFTKNLSSKIYTGLAKFGLPYILPGLFVICMDLIDRFFLKFFYGESVVGIYGAAYKLAMVMALAVGAFRFAWHPFFLSIADKETARTVFSRVLSYYLLASGWIYLAITYFVHDIVSVPIPFVGGFLIAREYQEGVNLVPVIMLAYLIYGVYVNFIVGIYIKKKSKHLLYITGIAASTNIVLNYLLIPEYGMMGAAVATVCAYAVMTLILFVVTRKFYPVDYEYKRLLHICIVAALLFILQSFLPEGGSLISKSALLISYPFILLISGFFTSDEIHVLKSVFIKRS